MTQREWLDELDAALDPETLVEAADRPPLYHYTTAPGLMGILREKAIWASHFRQANDRDELIVGDRVVRDESKQRAATFLQGSHERTFLERFASSDPSLKLSAADVYVASFSEEDDLLSQWRGYGNNGLGYAIGFDHLPLPYVESVDGVGVGLFKCEYDEGPFRKRVSDELVDIAKTYERFLTRYATRLGDETNIMNHSIAAALRRMGQLIPRLKSAGFREEKEWRLVAIPPEEKPEDLIEFRASPRGVLSYIPIDMVGPRFEQMHIKEIVVGPAHDPAVAVREASLLLRKYGYADAAVRGSSIPFRG